MIGRQLKAMYQVDRNKVRSIVRAALEDSQGSKTAAAKQLLIGTRTLWRWIDENNWHDIGAGLPNAKLGRIVER